MAPNIFMDLESGYNQNNEERSSVQCSKRAYIECPERSPICRKRRKTTECSVSLQGPSSPMSSIIQAVENLTTDSDLIADGSRAGCLPTVNGKNTDLKSISSKTMADLMQGQYNNTIDNVTIVDCRYPYEYTGGHIEGAVNLYTKDSIQSFINETEVTSDKVHVLIFHCEFSSERGPKMYRFLRALDRDLNKENYPKLNFPEVYLLEGGYKVFYQSNDSLCEPRDYVPMLHQNYGKDLRHFRVKSKSWTAGEKVKPRYWNGPNVGKKLF